jgi:myo-inositol-1(or 4)-monophosphatase
VPSSFTTATAPGGAELHAALDAVHEAGDVLRRHFRSGVTTEWKGRRDVVTVADREAEAVVRRRLRAVFPDDAVVGEEGEELHEDAVRGRRRWYVDPLDGTTNFVKGQPRWSVAVGFCDERDRLVAAAVHVPLAGETVSATLGGGAHCAGRVLRVPDPALHEALAFLGPLTALPPLLEAVAQRVLSVRVSGSTVCDLVDVACGRGDLYLGAQQGRWDLAAGTLIAAEAGAVVTDLHGDAVAGPTDQAFVAAPTLHAALSGHVRTAALRQKAGRPERGGCDAAAEA